MVGGGVDRAEDRLLVANAAELGEATEGDSGQRAGLGTSEQQRLKELEREVKELRRANDILRTASTLSRGGARTQTEVVNAYIDEHREVYGVEPICKVLQVAPSAYRRHAARQRDPSRRSARALRDEHLKPHFTGSARRIIA
jgi:hypothetical protein